MGLFSSAGPAIAAEGLDSLFGGSSQWAVAIADSKTSRMIYEKRSDEPVMPASNMKLFITASAFDQLGTRYRYRTPLMCRGALGPNGVWQGDFMVRGSGDPTFSGRFEKDKNNVTAALDHWADKIRQYGITAIQGNIIGFDDIYDENYWGSGWPENSWNDWFTAPAGGLILNDNCLDVAFYPSKIGSPVLVRLVPETTSIPINNKAVTVKGKTSQSLFMSRPFESNRFDLKGKLGISSGPVQVTVAITDPTAFFVSVFKDLLQRHGIKVTGEAIDADLLPDLPKKGWRAMDWRESPPLTEIVKVINTRSQNLFADSLLKTLGYRHAGLGNWENGEAAVKKYLQSRGINTDKFVIKDGSGLSRLNRVTSRATLDLLLKSQTEPWFGEWKSTLAIAGGSEGSLRKRLRTPLLEGKVVAKTGFIDNVYSLSGYIETPNQRTYAFSMFYNGNGSRIHPHETMEKALTFLARNEP